MEPDIKQILTDSINDVEVENVDGSVNHVLNTIRIAALVMSVFELCTMVPFKIMLNLEADADDR